MVDVTPLPHHGRAVEPTPRPRPIPRQRLQDERQAIEESLTGDWPDDPANFLGGEELVFLRPGVPHRTLRRLRSGFWSVQAELDLHGLTSDEAREALAMFLLRCRLRHLRCIRIIHGKGLRSRNREPVLKHKLRHWLTLRDEVLAYVQARPADGGGGAALVLLRGE